MPFIRTMKDYAFRTYCTARNIRPVWYHVLNHASKKVWKEHEPRITNLIAASITGKIIDSLRRDGIAVTDVASLFPDMPFGEARDFASKAMAGSEVREEILCHEKMIAARVEEGGARKGAKKYLKDFIVEPYGSTQDQMIPDMQNPYIRMNLDERVLKIAGGYMDLAPKFRGFHLRITLPVPAGAAEYFSQRWHRDPEDRNMLKMFIYMTDVLDEESGPFIYIRGSHPGGPYGRVFPQRPPSAMYPNIGEVEKVIPREFIKTCFGRTGTVIFADTSGLHKGGYTTTKPRVMYTGAFLSAASLAKHRLISHEDLSRLSPLARYALL